MPPFKNLIFDIGNVIVDIDYTMPLKEFQKLSNIDFTEIVSHSQLPSVFHQFEKGRISVTDFHRELKQFLRKEVTDQEILHAWNSILIHYPKQKFDLLNRLRSTYKVYALSNINETHVEAINAAVREKFGAKAFSDYFDAAYYSNEIGCRKPEAEIYEWVKQKENLIPEETFFVDDMPENVEAAKKAGWRAFHLNHPNKLAALLAELKIT